MEALIRGLSTRLVQKTAAPRRAAQQCVVLWGLRVLAESEGRSGEIADEVIPNGSSTYSMFRSTPQT